MADNDLKPLGSSDLDTPPAGASFQPAEPLKNAGVEFSSAADDASSRAADAKQALKDGAQKYSEQATDRIRTLADTGKERATGQLDQFSQLLNDAAAQVDDKLGAQYGDYARSAANAVSSFSADLRNKDVDQVFDDVRELVRKSPGVAVGVAAALGFVVARLVQAGLDSDRA
ncbi:ElaB/YqjD/DUF883 family membrane-anchored ribosome-binding protein [Sphingomonas jinjuensis]|uniref:ElaB/YqjD/DUF883 family membrane-anchored ribosome-binding protein n=1 Tax=Sphingomonas jinjuensis TaxID=535907 RepID=A0A840FB00_9SPHN|nr:hypothetical protein [Sphingomonas jinjuensis]MBB4152954.1 ElaB/YqjD/DUF883 family membrane-anchored ribosome-binding protein [Sphingomonas jinjuensis]